MSYLLIRETTQRAAKRHRCIWCGESIPAGTSYVREVGTFERDLQNNPWHPECHDAGRAYFDTGEDEFTPFDNERPPSQATLEYESWDCTLLLQRRLPFVAGAQQDGGAS